MPSTAAASDFAGGEDSADRLWGIRNSVWLWLIVIAGVVLRLIALGHKSFWIDEIASVSIAQKPAAAFWRFLWHDEGNMALYYLLLRPWLQFGKAEATVRLLSVLPGVASIPFFYLMGKRLFDRNTAILAALLLALNPCAIASSQEARAYSFLILAVIVSTYRFIRLVERPSYRFAIAYGVVAGFTCYFHYFGVLIPAAHAVSMLAMPRGRRPWKQYTVAGLLFALLAAPVVWLIHAQDVGHISWVQRPSLLEFYHLGVFLAGNGGKAVGAVLLVLDLVLIGFFLAKLRSVAAQRDNDLGRWHYALVASLFFSPIVITLAVSIVTPAFYHRFLVICLPPFILMSAAGSQRVSQRACRVALVTAVCVLSVVGAVISYTRVTEDWRGAVTYLIAGAHSQDRVLYYQPVGYFAGQNYRGWLPGGEALALVDVAVEQDDAAWKKEIAQASRVWLVLYRAKPGDPNARAIEEEIRKRFDASDRKDFRGITVMKYRARL